jgi:hypothetical protein
MRLCIRIIGFHSLRGLRATSYLLLAVRCFPDSESAEALCVPEIPQMLPLLSAISYLSRQR